VHSLSMRFHIATANLWRDMHNPLRGLTMQRAVMYLEEGERGAYADLQWLYRYVEKRDATVRGGKRSLLGAVAEMDWDIKQVDDKKLPRGYTKAQADAQAVTLRTAYDAVSNLAEALEFLGLAEFRGYSHLEKVQDGSGQVVKLLPVEQWYWCRSGLNGEWQYNAKASPGKTTGEEVDLSRFIIREIDDPVNEIALIAFTRKLLGRKDEDGFIESFGIPSIFAIMPQNVPQGREDEYQALAEGVIGDSRGALPFGSEIKTVDAGARGVAPFRDYQEALDKEIVMAITSGALTMLAESGSGTLAGGAHSDTFMRVARSLARRITSAMQAQFDLQILAAAHPGQPPLAYFEILTNEETNVSEVVEDVSALKAAGYTVEPGWLEEKTGYPVTVEAAPNPADKSVRAPLSLPNKAGPEEAGNPAKDGTSLRAGSATAHEPDDDFLIEALALMSDAEQADFKPVAARLQELMSEDLSDEDLRAGLELLLEDLPKLAAEVAASEETVEAWQAILGAAMGNELSLEDLNDEK
jgi:phage gp29-like protein